MQRVAKGAEIPKERVLRKAGRETGRESNKVVVMHASVVRHIQ